MRWAGIGKFLLLPFLDAIALGSIAAGLILFVMPHSTRSSAYAVAEIFMTVAASVALAVFVIEVLLHMIVRALAASRSRR